MIQTTTKSLLFSTPYDIETFITVDVSPTNLICVVRDFTGLFTFETSLRYEKNKNNFTLFILIISFLFSQYLFSNWSDLKAGLRGNCTENEITSKALCDQ